MCNSNGKQSVCIENDNLVPLCLRICRHLGCCFSSHFLSQQKMKRHQSMAMPLAGQYNLVVVHDTPNRRRKMKRCQVVVLALQALQPGDSLQQSYWYECLHFGHSASQVGILLSFRGLIQEHTSKLQSPWVQWGQIILAWRQVLCASQSWCAYLNCCTMFCLLLSTIGKTVIIQELSVIIQELSVIIQELFVKYTQQLSYRNCLLSYRNCLLNTPMPKEVMWLAYPG